MGAAEGGAPPSEQWAAPNGALGGELRRNTNGGVPVDDTSHQYQKQASAVRESSQPNFTLKKKKNPVQQTNNSYLLNQKSIGLRYRTETCQEQTSEATLV